MIKISGNIVTRDKIVAKYPPNSLERKIAEQLSSNQDVHNYDSLNQLEFDIKLRSNIVESARELDRSDLSFTTFRRSRCNRDYWQRTDEGGFLLKEHVKASDAIKDIFINTSKYGTECATAIVIIYYKALLNVLPEKLFNEMFPSIYLFDWQYLNRNLHVESYGGVTEFFPGDCQYFKNPDVNPATPEWQGENVINLGDGTYYGHGIGITSANGIIRELNRNRRRGATESAFLTDSVTRLNSKEIFDKYYNFSSTMRIKRCREIHRGYPNYLYY
ncbi:protein-glutamine gamma-glutamyltransferase [Clostridium botulinum]|uniref:protein-glutamine gamma-glutamyltransferase n=1 Tax=Clostridium botulinum TaxID=1491 RepID=UPI003DA33DF6